MRTWSPPSKTRPHSSLPLITHQRDLITPCPSSRMTTCPPPSKTRPHSSRIHVPKKKIRMHNPNPRCLDPALETPIVKQLIVHPQRADCKFGVKNGSSTKCTRTGVTSTTGRKVPPLPQLSPCLSPSLTLTHTLSLTPALSLNVSLSLYLLLDPPLSFSLALSRSLTLSLSHTHRHPLYPALSLNVFLSLSLSPSFFLSLTLSLAQLRAWRRTRPHNHQRQSVLILSSMRGSNRATHRIQTPDGSLLSILLVRKGHELRYPLSSFREDHDLKDCLFHLCTGILGDI